jgi:hypothetical protein
MRRFWSLFLPLLLALSVGSCKVTSINYFPPHPAQVRVLNLLPGIPAVDVLVNGTPLWTGVAYQSATGYQSLENTVQQATINIAGTSTTLVSGSFPLAGEQPYTLTITGTPSQPTINLLQEVASIPSNGSILISAFNAAANASSLDLYTGTPGFDITNIAPTYFGLNYNGTTYNVSFSPGTYQIIATQSGTKTIVYDSGPVTITANNALFFITYSAGSSVLVNAAMLQSQGTARFQNNLLARVKTVHAAPDTGAVDLLQSGVPIITNVSYSGVGGYTNVPQAVAQVMSFVNTGTLTPTLAAVTATLAPGTDQTVFITGFPSAPQAVYLPDLNLPAPNGAVNVRIVNASPNAGPITVTSTASTTPMVTGLPAPTASGYNIIAEGTYTFTFTDTATGATLLTLSNVVLTAPQTSSIYLIGPATALTGVVTQDY